MKIQLVLSGIILIGCGICAYFIESHEAGISITSTGIGVIFIVWLDRRLNSEN